jgi:hypothetical protein
MGYTRRLSTLLSRLMLDTLASAGTLRARRLTQGYTGLQEGDGNAVRADAVFPW